MTSKKRENEKGSGEKEDTDEKRLKTDDTTSPPGDEKEQGEKTNPAKKEEEEKVDKSGRAPRRQWLSPVGQRHPRIGNSFQATQLPSPGSFEASSKGSD